MGIIEYSGDTEYILGALAQTKVYIHVINWHKTKCSLALESEGCLKAFWNTP